MTTVGDRMIAYVNTCVRVTIVGAVAVWLANVVTACANLLCFALLYFTLFLLCFALALLCFSLFPSALVCSVSLCVALFSSLWLVGLVGSSLLGSLQSGHTNCVDLLYY